MVSRPLPGNSAAAVQGPKHVVAKGVTLVLSPAEVRMLGDWLVVSQVLPVNPAAAVREPTAPAHAEDETGKQRR